MALNNKVSFVWSSTVVWLTIILSIVILIAYIGLIYGYINTVPFKIITLKSIIILVVTVIMVYAVSLIPTSLTWSEQGIHIDKVIGNVFISKSSIKSITVITYNQLNNPSRRFGSGGYGGYNGLFWNKELGLFTMYVTNKKSKLLFIQTSDKKYVISCNSADDITKLFNTANR
jgi:hypothetical protein